MFFFFLIDGKTHVIYGLAFGVGFLLYLLLVYLKREAELNGKNNGNSFEKGSGRENWSVFAGVEVGWWYDEDNRIVRSAVCPKVSLSPLEFSVPSRGVEEEEENSALGWKG